MKIAAAILLASCLAATVTTAWARPLLPRPEAVQIAPPGGDGFVPRGRVTDDQGEAAKNLNANDAARQAQSINGGGRVLSVEESRDGWRVKLLKDGNVRIVFVPD
ncbi:MAG: hypothetical protein V4709_04085 [Pseudomonadota bacterium]